MRYLAPIKAHPRYIDKGFQFVNAQSGDYLTVHNPADGLLVSDKIHSAGEEDVNAAVVAAQKAFKGPWGRMDPTERAKSMVKFADLVRDKAGEVARLESLAMGSAVTTQTMGYTVLADLFTYYAGLADKIHGETSYPTSLGKYKIVQREPIGVCAGIGAWNVSPILFAWKAAVSAAGFFNILQSVNQARLSPRWQPETRWCSSRLKKHHWELLHSVL